jgi:deoxyribonuclease V
VAGTRSTYGWGATDDETIEIQQRVGRAAAEVLSAAPWSIESHTLFAGCFAAYARGEAGPGKPGDRAWAAAVAWRPTGSPDRGRRGDAHLRGGSGAPGLPRRADDVVAQTVVRGVVAASYVPGLLARREGPVLAEAVGALDLRPGVLLVDATGTDHPRGAGLAVHLGAVCDLPTVGVTQRPLVATGAPPVRQRGAIAPVSLEGRRVGYWVCTRTNARAVVAHAGWRTDPETAAATVLAASTEAARTPVPLQEARRVAREARASAERR